jgi:hypothetical protein
LELVEIPKGLIELLQNAGFTIEKILDSQPSEIAEKLGINSYVVELIHKETSKAISKINPPDLLLTNNIKFYLKFNLLYYTYIIVN